MPRYFLTPAADRDSETATQAIHRQLSANRYSWGERTPFVRDLRPGDHICFYAAKVGVVADAAVASRAEHAHGAFPWHFAVTDPHFISPPVLIDADLRARLDAFNDKDPTSTRWSWFVQVTREVSENDFKLLTDA